MASITIDEAQATLGDLIHQLAPGQEVVITENDRPVAMLVAAPNVEFAGQPRPAGTAKDRILWMAEDFNAPLDDFEEDSE